MPARDGEEIEAHPQRLADIVYDRLAEAVVSGDLAPGQRVRDGELAEKLGVSRMPVREALQRLERQGLIEMVASRYTRVTDLTPDALASSVEFLGYQAGVALRIAVPRMDDQQLERAVQLAREVADSASESAEVTYDAARDLYAHLAACSGNFLFERMVADAWLVLARNLRGAQPLLDTPERVREAFLDVADAIAKRDAIDAEARLRRFFHIGPGQDGPAAVLDSAVQPGD